MLPYKSVKKRYGGMKSGPPRKRVKSDHAQLLALKRKVSALSPEVKLRPVTFNATNVTTAGNIQYVSTIAQGVNETERIGNKIRMTGCEMAVRISSGAAAVAGTKFSYCMWLIKDTQAAGATPTIAATANAIFQSASILDQQFVSYNTRDRFKIVASHTWDANALYLGATPTLITRKFKLDHICEFHDTGATVASAGKNAYFLVFGTDDSGAVVDFEGTINFLFTDV